MKQISVQQFRSFIDAKMPQELFIPADKIQKFVPNTICLADDEAFWHASNMEYISGLIAIDKQEENTNEICNKIKKVNMVEALKSVE